MSKMEESEDAAEARAVALAVAYMAIVALEKRVDALEEKIAIAEMYEQEANRG